MNTNEGDQCRCGGERFTIPAVRTVERADGLDMAVEIPGVGKDEVDLHVDGRTMTLKTRANPQNPAGFRPAVREFQRTNYAASFELPEWLDATTVKGRVENGILSISMQKRAEVQPRRIEIG